MMWSTAEKMSASVAVRVLSVNPLQRTSMLYDRCTPSCALKPATFRPYVR